jgi:Fe-S cluster assembly scaffold protein SufB
MTNSPPQLQAKEGNSSSQLGVLSGAGGRLLELRGIALHLGAKDVLRGLNLSGARGHVDCTEIVRDHAVVSAIPEVNVPHPQAKVTHEVAIGSVDSSQLETLMARGLDPDSAAGLISR